MEESKSTKYQRAKKRVEEIKGFYIHAAVYTVINAFILLNIYLQTDYFWKWPHFITLFAWGIGLFFHGSKVFGFNPFLSKDWEEKQIQKFMEEDKEEMKKYK
ncbi:2TM domain-containing protein [Flagellimonas sp. GZD32]|uniref:2TM domain-containing protein n=1 Tax=Flagellimonas cixiensis TaxID=3228750 RepID=UPI0035C8F8B8